MWIEEYVDFLETLKSGKQRARDGDGAKLKRGAIRRNCLKFGRCLCETGLMWGTFLSSEAVKLLMNQKQPKIPFKTFNEQLTFNREILIKWLHYATPNQVARPAKILFPNLVR